MAQNEIVLSLIRALEQALPEGDVVLVGSAKSKGLTEANKAWLASLIGVEPTATDKALTLDLLDEIQEEIEDVIAKHRVALMTDADDEDDDYDEDDEDTDDDDSDEDEDDAWDWEEDLPEHAITEEELVTAMRKLVKSILE